MINVASIILGCATLLLFLSSWIRGKAKLQYWLRLLSVIIVLQSGEKVVQGLTHCSGIAAFGAVLLYTVVCIIISKLIDGKLRRRRNEPN